MPLGASPRDVENPRALHEAMIADKGVGSGLW